MNRGFNQSSDPPALPAPTGPKMCAAHGCMFPGSTAENSYAVNWWCAYHYGCHSEDIARITSVLNQHHVLRDAILEGRYALVHGPQSMLSTTWQVLRARVFDHGYTVPAKRGSETFTGWLWEVELLLGKYVRGIDRPPPLPKYTPPPPGGGYTPPGAHNIGDLLDGVPKRPDEPRLPGPDEGELKGPPA